MAFNKFCRFLYLTQWRSTTPDRGATWTDDVPTGNSIDDYQCAWKEALPAMPPPVRRMPMPLRNGDCDKCPCFEAIQVKIPGVK